GGDRFALKHAQWGPLTAGGTFRRAYRQACKSLPSWRSPLPQSRTAKASSEPQRSLTTRAARTSKSRRRARWWTNYWMQRMANGWTPERRASQQARSRNGGPGSARPDRRQRRARRALGATRTRAAIERFSLNLRG